MKPLQTLLVFFCLSALALLSHAARIDVSSAADIAAANPRPGDYLQMAAGEWKNQKIVFSAVGTAEAPIKLVGSDSVTLTGTSMLKMSGAWLVATKLRFVGGSFATADDDVVSFAEDSDTFCYNCTLSHSLIQDHKPKNLSVDYKWVSLYGQRNKVYNCTFQGKANLGALLSVWKRVPTGVVAKDEDRHSISFNRFLKRKPVTGEDNDQEAIRIGTSGTNAYSNTAVYSNYFEDMNGEVEVVSSKSHGNQFYNNTFVRCKGGLTLRRAERNVVFGNKFYGQDVEGTGGVRVGWGDKHLIYNNYFESINPGTSKMVAAVVIMNGQVAYTDKGYKPITNILVAFNTMRNCRANVVFNDAGYAVASEGGVFANNLILTNLTADAASDTIVRITDPIAAPVDTKWINNIIWSTVGTAAAPSACSGSWVVTNPKLASSGWKVSASSPAVGRAVSGSAWNSVVTDDILGLARATSPSNRTIGAWEY